MSKVYGHGITDVGTMISTGNRHPAYNFWKNMLERCYSKRLQKKYPTYMGCSVCEEWLVFSQFEKWFDEHYIVGYQVDKDIFSDVKEYSPINCCMIPKRLNVLLAGRYKHRTLESARLFLLVGDITQVIYDAIIIKLK